MNEQKNEYNLIEYVLTLLSTSALNNLDMDSLMENSGQAAPGFLPDTRDTKTVYEVIQFMEEMPGGFLIYRADGDEEIIYANRALLRIFQCETMREFRTLTGNSFRGMVHPDDLEEVEESIWAQIASNQYDLDYVEYRIIRQDGAVCRVEDYGHFIHSDRVGNIFYVFITDATEKMDRQRAEKEKLQNLIEKYDQERALINQEHLRRLEVIEGLSINYESILYADLDRDRILPYRLSSRTTHQFDEKFETRSLSWYVKDYVDFWVHPEDRELVAKNTEPEYIREKLRESKTYYINYRVINRGEIQYIQLRLVNVGRGENVSQIVMGYRCIDEEVLRDMEQNKLLEEALNNANLAIVAKNTFLSNMSHDMRTPLNAIFGFTALARKNILDSREASKYLDKIEASSRQLLDLIEKVLEIAWTESHDSLTEETECDIEEIAGEVYDFLLPQAAEKNITFFTDYTELRHSGIYSDPERLRQLLMYLANNAVTYTKSGGKVDIIVRETEMLPGHCAVYQFIVRDTGIGISKEFLERIFEPYERERNITISGIHGIGLGLTIAKNIVRIMGGTIEAKSKLGEGSTFTVTLRFRLQDQSDFSRDGEQADRVCLTGKKILLVEDNEINLEIETELLEEAGFFIDTATDGSDAVEKVSASRPGDYDLVLMDIQMPVMDGRQAARAIRGLKDPVLAGIPIIALSANAFESDIRASIESGMDAHLTKPLDFPMLLRAIERLFEQH